MGMEPSSVSSEAQGTQQGPPTNAAAGGRARTACLIVLASLLLLAAADVRADVVVVAGAASTLEALDAGAVARIFLGKTETAPGGGRVVPVDQPEGAAARDEFYRQEGEAGKS